MTVTLPDMTEIENALMEAFQSLNAHQINFPEDMPEKINDEVWGNYAKKATESIWGKISLQDNIYFIFGQDEKLLDVGKASSKNRDIRNRLKRHIISCSDGTSSKLQLVKDYICCKRNTTIYVATLRIEPEEYYQMAESFYIANCNPVWNSRID